MIDGNRKDAIKKHEEQHLIVDWHRSLTESYCREFFHSRGLVFRFSLVVSTLRLIREYRSYRAFIIIPMLMTIEAPRPLLYILSQTPSQSMNIERPLMV